jgi:DNA-binding NarL/FixJ family response regulator
MRRLDLPTLHILSTDDAVFRRISALDAHRQTRRITDLGELARLADGSLLIFDTAHAQCPAWDDKRWRSWCDQLTVVVASSEPNDAEGILAMEVGAAGYCHIYANPAILRQVIEVVCSGELWVGRSLLTRLLRGVSGKLPPAPAARTHWRQQLTEREIEVAQLAAHGESNLVIAEQLGITERTVKAHLTTIFSKLGVTDRLQLALKVHGVK